MVAGPQLSKTLVGLAGEFLVAGQLCLRGYVASLTLKNYPGVDIFALNPRTSKQVAIQVKTIKVSPGRRTPATAYPQGAYFIHESVDEHPDRPFVFVAIASLDQVDYFIVPGLSVADISERERQQYLDHARSTGRTVSEAQPRMTSLQSLSPFKDRWELLGLED